MPDPERCPTCASPVRVVGGEEGTCYYEPVSERVVNALSELLARARDDRYPPGVVAEAREALAAYRASREDPTTE